MQCKEQERRGWLHQIWSGNHLNIQLFSILICLCIYLWWFYKSVGVYDYSALYVCKAIVSFAVCRLFFLVKFKTILIEMHVSTLSNIVSVLYTPCLLKNTMKFTNEVSLVNGSTLCSGPIWSFRVQVSAEIWNKFLSGWYITYLRSTLTQTFPYSFNQEVWYDFK